jgi:CBS domain-containing protein
MVRRRQCIGRARGRWHVECSSDCERPTPEHSRTMEVTVNAKIRDVLESKGRYLETVSARTAVLDGVVQMNRCHIGSLLVMDGNRLAGIMTERDVLIRVVARQLDPAKLPIGEVMTREVVVIDAADTVLDAFEAITNYRCRHLPVIEDGKLGGIVSSGDLTAWLVRDHQQTIADLEDYITRS